MPTKLVNGVRIELTQEEVAALEAEQAARAIPNAIAKKRKEILAQYNASVAQLTAGYDSQEIASWPQQAEEAKARNANANAPAPLIEALATARGMTMTEMVSRILQKESAFKPIFGTILGTKQARLLALESAQTLEQIEAI
jgi:antitoxin component HigA of HigAB toxin-antitoxin module